MEVNKFVVELGFTRQGRLVGHIRGTYRSSNYGPHRATYACFPDPPPPELRVGDSLRACDR